MYEALQNNFTSSYRSQFINEAYQEVLDLLLPLNLEVIVERNLSWEWYQEVPCFNVNAQLKPMEVTFGCLLIFVFFLVKKYRFGGLRHLFVEVMCYLIQKLNSSYIT